MHAPKNGAYFNSIAIGASTPLNSNFTVLFKEILA